MRLSMKSRQCTVLPCPIDDRTGPLRPSSWFQELLCSVTCAGYAYWPTGLSTLILEYLRFNPSQQITHEEAKEAQQEKSDEKGVDASRPTLVVEGIYLEQEERNEALKFQTQLSEKIQQFYQNGKGLKLVKEDTGKRIKIDLSDMQHMLFRLSFLFWDERTGSIRTDMVLKRAAIVAQNVDMFVGDDLLWRDIVSKNNKNQRRPPPGVFARHWPANESLNASRINTLELHVDILNPIDFEEEQITVYAFAECGNIFQYQNGYGGLRWI
jgi:hypothetical protein